MLSKILINLHREGPERVGFIRGDEIIEVVNTSHNPEMSFQVSTEDIIKHADASQASWHTHPYGDANLSSEDHIAFRNWPELRHYIIGTDGVRCYQYDKVRKEVVEIQQVD